MAKDKARGSDGKFEAPNIHTSRSSSTRKYYFENRQQPGVPLSFFAGNAQNKDVEGQENQMRTYHLEHGTEVELTEEMAQHIKSKGTYKPIMEENERGEVFPTGKKYLDRRFDLHEV